MKKLALISYRTLLYGFFVWAALKVVSCAATSDANIKADEIFRKASNTMQYALSRPESEFDVATVIGIASEGNRVVYLAFLKQGRRHIILETGLLHVPLALGSRVVVNTSEMGGAWGPAFAPTDNDVVQPTTPR